MFKNFFGKVLQRLRGRPLTLDSRVRFSLLFKHACDKGIGPLLRGTYFRMYFGSAKGLVFIGWGSKIFSPSKLSVGKGFYLGRCSYIDCLSTGGVSIGDNVTIREFAWLQISSGYAALGDLISIGSRNYFGPRSIIGASARITIGDDNQFGANLSLVAENHKFDGDGEVSKLGVSREGITIGSGCWFGNNVTVLDGVRIGDGVVLGAGSVVTKDIPARGIAYGVPARLVRFRQ